MSYDTFDDGYQGIQLKCFDQWLRWYNRGEYVPLYEGFLPKNCIIAKHWYDEVDREQGYVFLLFKNSRYINCFYHLQDIKGKFPIYEDSPFSDKPLKEDWVLLDHNYFKEKKRAKMKANREKPLTTNIFEVLKEKGYFEK